MQTEASVDRVTVVWLLEMPWPYVPFLQMRRLRFRVAAWALQAIKSKYRAWDRAQV